MNNNHWLLPLLFSSWIKSLSVGVYLTFLIGSGLNGQTKLGIEELYEQGLAFQKTMNRVALDSISDIMIDVSETLDDQHYINMARYFKSDALSRSDPTLAIELGEQALQYFHSVDDVFNLSRMSNVIAHSYNNIGEHLKAVDYYKASAQYSNLLAAHSGQKEKKYRSRVYYNCGFALVRRGDLDGAMELFTESHKTATELKDSLLLMSIFQQYGNINLYRENYNKAMDDFQASLALAERIGMHRYITPLLGVASVYQLTERTDSAMNIYQTVIDVSKEQNNISTLCAALTNSAEMYVDLGEYEKGIELGSELLNYAQPLGMKHQEFNGILILIRAYKEQRQVQRAITLAEETIARVDNGTGYDQVADLYQLASELKETQQDFQAALHYQKNYKEFSDSLLNRESLGKIDELEMKFESDQKDAQIQQLEARNELDALAYKQRLTLLGALLIGLVLSCIVVYLFINRKRLLLLRQKENVERRLLRSQMNPHFIFNAISSIQNYLYDKSDLKVALNYMSKFAELMRQVLENSREEYVVLSEEIKSLENYLELQQLRYNNSFGYKIIIDDELDIHEVKVPPLIAQPFVENAIEHGMIYRIENGQVKIAFMNNKDKIDLRIQDNGVGDDSVKIERKQIAQKKKSLAKIITSERLDLLSKIKKAKFHFSISNPESGGTIVSVELPKILVA